MSDINVVVVVGRLTRDAELKATKGGTPVLTFGVAVNESKHNKQTGEWDEVPSFFDVVLYGKRAESLSRFLAKGMKVTIQGRLSQRSWEKDGQKRSRVEIVAGEVSLPPRGSSAPQAAPQGQVPAEVLQAVQPLGVRPEDIYYDEDLPF